MNPVIPAAAVHAALKSRIEREYQWSLTEARVRHDKESAHMVGRAWAFGKVLEWLKEITE